MSYYTRYYEGTTTPSGYRSYPSYRPQYDLGSHRPAYSDSLWKMVWSWGSVGGNHLHQDGGYGRYDTDYRPASTPAPKRGVSVDFKKSENKKNHHTDEYEVGELIVRRGQEVNLVVNAEGFDKESDVIKLFFTMGKKPMETKGTMIRLSVGGKMAAQDGVAMVNSEGGATELRITFPSDALVGKYSLMVAILKGGDKAMATKHTVEEPLYVIFNPWCKEDNVFLAEEEERKEYVLNDSGRIFVGNNRSIQGKPWNFGQFEKVSLTLALDLLEKSKISNQAYSNPTLVTRALSALVNSNDDNGVLQGRWDGKYSGGTSPTAWNGSPAIFEEYARTRRPVRYGQCWVFSGLLTTVCRTLGIPTRSVTNFESAHDHDLSMTIDDHMDSSAQPLDHLSDSVWNFHVWNEAWFRRPDLPAGYDGWQAFDSTPQESSEGVMQCGPASVAAIKEGNIFLGYDAKFIFAEVNGDKITWVHDDVDNMVATRVQTGAVGQQISTKAVGSNYRRQDITSHYKYPEGSQEEREAVKRASHHSTLKDKLRHVYNMSERQDVQFDFDGLMASNGDVRFVVKSCNAADEPRTFDIFMHATAKYYTGIPGDRLGEKKFSVTLEAGKDESTEWKLASSEYFNVLDEDASIGIYVLAKVKETGQIFTASDTFWVEKPELDIKVSDGTARVSQELSVTISFTNPLGIPLSSGTLRVEGPGIKSSRSVHLKRIIQPGQQVSEVVTITPKLAGSREIIANFHSKQLVNICGAVQVTVTK